MHYNPAEQIDADQWLSIDEGERLYAIQCWLSELTGSDIDDCLLEAVPILAVENQVAMDDPPVTRATLERLLRGGIDRMTAIQVLSEVMAESLGAVVSEQQDYDSDAYARALEQIDPTEIALDGPNDEAARKGAGGLAYRQTPSAPPTRQPVRSEKIGRNQPCPCGSGKKYKKCCGRPGAGRLH